MPICPKCGQQFAKGGTFNTHVKNCDEEPQEDAPDSQRLDHIEARLDRIEEAVASVNYDEEVSGLQDAVDTLQTEISAAHDVADLGDPNPPSLKVCDNCGNVRVLDVEDGHECLDKGCTGELQPAEAFTAD